KCEVLTVFLCLHTKHLGYSLFLVFLTLCLDFWILPIASFVLDAWFTDGFTCFYLFALPFDHEFWIAHSSIKSAYGSSSSLGCWSLAQLSSGERQDTPWTGRQSIAGQTDRQSHTPRGNLACPIGLSACLWTVGGIRRKPTQTRGEHANCTQRGTRSPGQGIKPRPSLL
ncbi:hypothetical protein MHYP_G00247500, partial [Metynnis hypsauchen]